MPSADIPSTPSSDSAAAADGREQTTTLRLRRAPRVSVFLTIGGIVGLIVGIIAGALGSGNANFTTAQVIGYMATIFALLGLALGAIAYLIADRVSVRRTHEVQALAESRTEAAESTARPVSEHPSDADDDGVAESPVGGSAERIADRRADVGD